MEPELDLPTSWTAALARAAAAARTVVLGPTDMGKSRFIGALAAARPELVLLDLDPGQKMIGPPGSVSLGTLLPEPRLERFIFLGSTAVGSFGALVRAGASLAASTGTRPLAVNTSGFVAGPGARLQLMTVQAIEADLVVAIGLDGALAAELWRQTGPRLLSIDPARSARRKPPAARRAVRQHGLEEALQGAEPMALDRGGILFLPAPPASFLSDARPVCALTDAQGEDMEIGILEEAGEGSVRLLARKPPRPVLSLRLGSLWVRMEAGKPRLLDSLSPAWAGEAKV